MARSVRPVAKGEYVPWQPGCYVHPPLQSHLQSQNHHLRHGWTSRIWKMVILFVHRHPIVWLYYNLLAMGLRRRSLVRLKFRDIEELQGHLAWIKSNQHKAISSWLPVQPVHQQPPTKLQQTKNKRGYDAYHCHQKSTSSTVLLKNNLCKLASHPTVSENHGDQRLEVNAGPGHWPEEMRMTNSPKPLEVRLKLHDWDVIWWVVRHGVWTKRYLTEWDGVSMLIEKTGNNTCWWHILNTYDTTHADYINKFYEERNAEGKQLTKGMCSTKALFMPRWVKS